MLKALAIPFQPSWNVSKRVETMLNRCWKSLKAFQLCFNIHSTFLFYSGIFGMLKRSWSRLPCSFNIVEQAHAQLRRRNHGHGVDAKTIAKQNSFHFRTSGRWLFDQLIPLWRTMRCQTILQKGSKEVRRDRNAHRWTRKEKLLVGYLCHEKRDIAYTELEDILKHSKQDIKMKIAGLRMQLGREISKTKSTWVFYDKLQFLRPVTLATKSKDNLSPGQQLLNGSQDEFGEESLSSASPTESLEATPRISKKARKSMEARKENFLSTCVEVLRETTRPQP